MDDGPRSGTCLCLMTQKAARALARAFDEALRPAGLTSGQFSLLMAIARSGPAPMGALAAILGADRTSLTAQAKPLVRDALVIAEQGDGDRRMRILRLTAKGKLRLRQAVPLWRQAHGQLESRLGPFGLDRLRGQLASLAGQDSTAGVTS